MLTSAPWQIALPSCGLFARYSIKSTVVHLGRWEVFVARFAADAESCFLTAPSLDGYLTARCSFD